MKLNIRLLYLYLFSFVGLIISVIGAIRLFELGLKVFVFKEADNYYYSRPVMPEATTNNSTEEAKLMQIEEINQEKQVNQQRQRDTAGALAMLFVGLPLYKYHWKVIQKEYKGKN